MRLGNPITEQFEQYSKLSAFSEQSFLRIVKEDKTENQIHLRYLCNVDTTTACSLYISIELIDLIVSKRICTKDIEYRDAGRNITELMEFNK